MFAFNANRKLKAKALAKVSAPNRPTYLCEALVGTYDDELAAEKFGLSEELMYMAGAVSPFISDAQDNSHQWDVDLLTTIRTNQGLTTLPFVYMQKVLQDRTLFPIHAVEELSGVAKTLFRILDLLIAGDDSTTRLEYMAITAAVRRYRRRSPGLVAGGDASRVTEILTHIGNSLICRHGYIHQYLPEDELPFSEMCGLLVQSSASVDGLAIHSGKLLIEAIGATDV